MPRLRHIRPLTTLLALALPLVVASAVALRPATVSAQDWPERRVVIVSPYSAGGITDLLARIFAESFAKSLGQPVVVENRVGAGAISAACT